MGICTADIGQKPQRSPRSVDTIDVVPSPEWRTTGLSELRMRIWCGHIITIMDCQKISSCILSSRLTTASLAIGLLTCMLDLSGDVNGIWVQYLRLYGLNVISCSRYKCFDYSFS